MKRGRAWRRYKNYTKAKRKKELDKDIHLRSWYGNMYGQPWYDNLHQYSKNTIFCSCHMCSAKLVIKVNVGIYREIMHHL